MSTTLVDADPQVPRWRLSRERYDAMVEAGFFDGLPVELLEGVLVEVSPMGRRHARAVTLLADALVRALDDRLLVGVQVPLAASDWSEPEPDVAVTDRAARSEEDHPRTAHLVIEVADTSLRTDLAHKPRLYAGARVPQYWVVDLGADEVVVHTDPSADPDDPGYRTVRRLPLETPLEVLGVTLVLAEIL